MPVLAPASRTRSPADLILSSTADLTHAGKSVIPFNVSFLTPLPSAVEGMENTVSH